MPYSMSVRGRGRFIDLLVIIVFLVIVYIFMVRHRNHVKSTSLPENHVIVPVDTPLLVPKIATDVTKDEKDQARITEIIEHVPDFRSESCKAVTHDDLFPTSIIIDFFDYSFYDMRVTITSIIKFTPESLIREIIIIDDGSTLDHIIEEAKMYVDKLPKAVLLRNEDREGQGRARIRGAKEAMGANLVFVDANVVVAPGWLEPLAAFINKEKGVIAVPHPDRVNDPVSYQFVKTEDGLTASLNWRLEVVMSRTKDVQQKDEAYTSPVIRGSIFAVTKDYFKAIQGLDSHLSDGGGDSLELSLRTWICGGSLKVVPCSRVGILNYKDPVKIVNNKNKWRITELWLSEYKELITKMAGKDLASNVGDLDKSSLSTRKHDIHQLQCTHDIKWYFDNVATDVFIPPANMKIQGFLQIKNGHCARVGKDKRVDLGNCNPDKHNLLPRDMIFVLTNDGLLKAGSQCVKMSSSMYMVVSDCNLEDNHQKWTYDNRKRLINTSSKFCAMHVTDPDPKLKEQKRQIVMAQNCDSDKSKDLEFSSWKFLAD